MSYYTASIGQNDYNNVLNKIDQLEPNSKKRYNVLIDLYKSTESNKTAIATFFLNDKLPKRILPYLEESITYALKNRSGDISFLLEIKFTQYFYYYFRKKESIIVSNSILDGDYNITPELKHKILYYLTTQYPEMGMYTEYIRNIPKFYAIRKALNIQDGGNLNVNSDIAFAYFESKQYKEAIEKWKMAFEDLKQTDRHIFKSSLHNNIGQAFSKLHQQDSALFYYNHAISLISDEKSESESWNKDYKVFFKANIETNIARVNYFESAPKNIIPFLKKEIELQLRSSDSAYVSNRYNSMGELYFIIGEYAEANTYLKKAEYKIDRYYNESNYLKNLSLQSQNYLAMGNLEKGIALKTKFERREDSIISEKNNTKTEIALALFNTEEKDRAIRAQKLLLKSAKEERLILVFLFSFLVVIIIVIVLFNSKIRNKNKLINAQKGALNTNLHEKELLLKEVHHRVKNNLQIISGLLNKQGLISESEEVQKVMSQGKDRIQSMSIIHQLLYENDSLDAIDLEFYSNTLIRSISSSYKTEDKTINYTINATKTLVNVDVAIPYGLIITELVTNIYKYAFKGRLEGNFSLNLNLLDNGQLELILEDDGLGLPENFNTITKTSLGYSLIKGLTWQLNGDLNYTSSKSGTKVGITFSKNLK
ncbi:tetratricopeptide repeat-containing sensor histidine kinase [Lacinutrix jangbogonensis]|uniref:tetratricopeptide repeat-containing sensor histidine kinase n=1 Tax=Lacinutrix jangbogonensis TaxID=1469557 RepID=UPI00053EAB6C|nr:histidine kinase dimerization/phosphoacceptor domain -containing protein [Lacinutrix jangbogonensis]